jgi:hypothetical protein
MYSFSFYPYRENSLSNLRGHEFSILALIYRIKSSARRMPRNMAQFERTNEAGVRRIEERGRKWRE